MCLGDYPSVLYHSAGDEMKLPPVRQEGEDPPVWFTVMFFGVLVAFVVLVIGIALGVSVG